jgi:hypothetical protein
MMRVAAVLAAALVLTSVSARAADAVIGINLGHAPSDNAAQQDVLIRDLKAAGVRTIRTGIGPDAPGIARAKRFYDAGIAIDWLPRFSYRADAPQRPWRPKEFPGMWAGPPLSAADPVQFRAYLQGMLDKLEAAGVVLAGIEMGNELNMAAFNPEFPLPGHSRQLGLDDLNRDPEGQQIARGAMCNILSS